MQGPGRPPFAPAFSSRIVGLFFLLQPSPWPNAHAGAKRTATASTNQPHANISLMPLAVAVAPPLPLVRCVRSGFNDALASKRAKVSFTFRQNACEQTSKAPLSHSDAANPLRANEQSPFGGGNPCEQSEQSPSPDLCSFARKPCGGKTMPTPFARLLASGWAEERRDRRGWMADGDLLSRGRQTSTGFRSNAL